MVSYDTMKYSFFNEFHFSPYFLYQDDAFQGSLNPLHSAYHPHLMALSLCFTSLNEGFLYHLPGIHFYFCLFT